VTIAALLTLLALVQEPVPFRDLHADGKTPEEVGAHLTLADGRIVLHGPYERFHRNGKSAARGEYELGLRTGPWELRHEDGKMRARGKYVRGLEEGPWVEFHERTAKKASEGSYRAGLRTGKWTFWDEDGAKRDFPTGAWKVLETKDAAGKVRARGAQIESTKDGPWLHLWPNGAAQFVARFELGRLDELFFLHPDGTLDPKWLSKKSLPRELPEWAEAFVAGLPRADLPLQVTPEARARVAEWLASGAEPGAPALVAEARLHVPAAVEALRACTLDTEEGRERARRLHLLLRQLFGGVGWDWSDKEGTLVVRRWASAWELLKDEDVLWQLDFDPRWRWLGHDLESSALLRPPGLEDLRDGGGRFGGRFGGPPAPFPKETLARAAAWLVAQQDARGLWRGERGDEVADTALVLLVLLGDGHSHRTGEHPAAVQRGLLALRARLAEPGALAGVRAHALVTWLHAELYDDERAPGLSLIVREHAGTLLERLGEDGRFSPDALEDAWHASPWPTSPPAGTHWTRRSSRACSRRARPRPAARARRRSPDRQRARSSASGSWRSSSAAHGPLRRCSSPTRSGSSATRRTPRHRRRRRSSVPGPPCSSASRPLRRGSPRSRDRCAPAGRPMAPTRPSARR